MIFTSLTSVVRSERQRGKWEGEAGNWLVKVYKQSEELAVQEAKW